ncbi:MAG: NYN domain-containing protein [Saprospiraceae bacterium]
MVNSPATARKSGPPNEPSRSNDYKPIIQGNPKAAPPSSNRPTNTNRPPVNVLPKPAPTPPKPEAKKENNFAPPEEKISIKLDQSVAILIDGNNIEMSLHSVSKKTSAMINFDKLVPTLLGNRALSRLIYFREGKSISPKLAERLQKLFHGSVVPCHKSADIPLSIKAVQVASKVDTIIILSGDADYVELVRHLKHDGIRVEIAAFPETTADILRQESDYFFPITVDYSFVLK